MIEPPAGKLNAAQLQLAPRCRCKVVVVMLARQGHGTARVQHAIKKPRADHR
jgi:hypothetical protein